MEALNHISLNKYISETGFCSRREADKLIEAGRVKLNDTIARKGNRATSDDKVYIDGVLLEKKNAPIYIALNKPVGIVCTTDSYREKDNIIDYIGFHERIFPIGRLDKMSEGLILLTNDGDIVNKILRAGNQHEKEYIVRVDKKIDRAFIKTMASGVPILNTVTNPCEVEAIDDYTFRIILKQGLNRQIRRMCEFLNYTVCALSRVRIMHLRVDNIPVGEWRLLTEKEIHELNNLLRESKK
jgi:23S rRNA pseudouridine2604 synthase